MKSKNEFYIRHKECMCKIPNSLSKFGAQSCGTKLIICPVFLSSLAVTSTVDPIILEVVYNLDIRASVGVEFLLQAAGGPDVRVIGPSSQLGDYECVHRCYM